MARGFSTSGVRQRGAVLFVSLVILLMLTLFAVAAANTAILEQKMASATRNLQLAGLAAESALNEAKARVSEAAVTYGAAQACFHLQCFVRPSGSPYDPEELMRTDQAQASMNYFRIDLTKLEGIDESARLAAPPSYLIEDIGASGSNRLFRITAIGFGGSRDYERAAEIVYPIAQ